MASVLYEEGTPLHASILTSSPGRTSDGSRVVREALFERGGPGSPELNEVRSPASTTAPGDSKVTDYARRMVYQEETIRADLHRHKELNYMRHSFGINPAKCYSCKEALATIRCWDCTHSGRYLCSDCDKSIHEKGNMHNREQYCSKKHEFIPIPIEATFQAEMCLRCGGLYRERDEGAGHEFSVVVTTLRHGDMETSVNVWK